MNLGEKNAIDAAFTHLPDRIDKFFGVAGLSGMKTDYHMTVTVNYIANKYITEQYLEKRVVPGGAIAYITSTAGLHWKRYRWEYRKLLNATGWEAMTAELHKLVARRRVQALRLRVIEAVPERFRRQKDGAFCR